MTHSEALKLALDALGKFSIGYHVDAVELNDLIATLEAALEQPEQELEPVAWRFKTLVNQDFETNWVLTKYEPPNGVNVVAIEPLYTHPPRREWRGLTEEDIWTLAANCLDSVLGRLHFARAIEATLKERNA
jgi:hypothetical protein